MSQFSFDLIKRKIQKMFKINVYIQFESFGTYVPLPSLIYLEVGIFVFVLLIHTYDSTNNTVYISQYLFYK